VLGILSSLTIHSFAQCPSPYPDLTVCVNDTENLPFEGDGVWSGNSVTNNVFAPIFPGTYTLTYIQSDGASTCTDEIEIIVNNIPDVDAGLDVFSCIGEQEVLTATHNATALQWTINGSNSFNNPLTIDVTQPVTIVVATAINPSTGCLNTDEVTVFGSPAPVITTDPTAEICFEGSTTLSASPAGGTWGGPHIDASGLFTSPQVAGDYTVTYTYQDGAGCSNSADVVVTVLNQLVVEAGVHQTFCADASDFVLTSSPAGGVWSGNGIVGGTSFSPSAVSGGLHTLTYSVTQGGCTFSDDVEMIVNDLPVVSAGTLSNFCAGDAPEEVQGFTPAGGGWSGPGISNSALGTFDPSGLSGAQELTYSVTDSNGCSNTDAISVEVNPLPTAVFSMPVDVCEGANFSVDNASTGADSYVWTFQPGNTTTSGFQPTFNFQNSGVETIDLTAISASGCSHSTSNDITIKALPEADFSLDNTIGCAPVEVNVTNQSTGDDLLYDWSFHFSNSSNPDPVTVIFPQVSDQHNAETYTISLSLTNGCGSDTHEETVTVEPMPQASFVASIIDGCSPLRVEFENTSVDNADSFMWNLDGGDTVASTDVNEDQEKTYITGSSTSNFTVELTATNGCGDHTFSTDVVVHPKTVFADFALDMSNMCAPFDLVVNDLTTGANNYVYELDNTVISVDPEPSMAVTNPGVYELVLFADDGCSFDTTAVQFEVLEVPSLDFNFSTTSFCEESVIDFFANSSIPVDFDWDFGDSSSETSQNTSHSYSVANAYNVTLTGTSTTNGCAA